MNTGVGCRFLMVGLTATFAKRAYAIPRSTAPRAPALAAVHCWPIPPQETLKHNSSSVFVGSLGPGAHKVLFVPSKSLFPQSCVSSDGSMVGLMATSSKRAYAIPKSAAPRTPALAAVHCWPVPPQETLKHNSGSVSVGSLGPGVHSLNHLSISGGYAAWF